ncbi:uncharacterized protein PAC_06281 [Phialocephala subalpina]|uniref:Luciferase-like domain-containing protein n=1 Tax=Phialocephala subalpina TaxID=576137 RepID=A0A1L7WUI3_9HELO|nr:uncharacterized protein PAC_06281 [Phialocephala subalpina]
MSTSQPLYPSTALGKTSLIELPSQAKFDTLFLADGAGSNIDDVTKRFWIVSAFEPVTLFSAIATRTEHIGLVYTVSVSDNEPNLVARQLASLDHISHGRGGWNVVTTPGPGSLNLRVPKEEEKDSVAKAEQPLRVEQPIQGHPVIAQAGTSAEGMAFGGANADIIYCANYSIEDGQKTYHTYKSHTVAAGRKPDGLLILTDVAVVWGETQEEAERKLREVSDLWPIEVAVHNLGMGFVIGEVDLDAPFPQDYDRDAGSFRQTAERCSVGLGHRLLIGTTQSIADDLQAWIEAEATDGFAVIQPLVIDGLREFAEHIIPELQRRGLFRSEYEGKTLRENLDVPRPENYYTLLRKGAA